MNTIGSRISALRKERGYSQEYVAEKLDVSRQAVSKWEQNLSAPDTYNLIALAELFSVSVEYIAVGRNEEKKEEAPPREKPLGVQQILGLIFIAAGLVATLIFLLIESVLIGVGIYLVVLGLLCLAIKKKAGLILCWLHWIVFGALISIFGGKPSLVLSFTWSTIVMTAYWLCLIPLLIFTFKKAVQKTLGKLSQKFDK